MTATALSENYCVCVGEDGALREIGRSGTAVTYKAMGYQSGQTVALQLIPLANVSESGRAQFEAKARAVRKLKHPNIARVFDVREEDDHIVFATEYLQGETAEAWVVAHGPMPPDAVVRVGLQVVSALAEAAFHSLSHRSIQPSNLMIVAGASPDGDWPFVKLLNFGLAGLKLYSEGGDELAPPIGAAFSSPEQAEKGTVDFRSEIFSLGATMCFLLTGAVPMAGRARQSRVGERILPSGAAMPRSLRRLLRRMLRINPDERPHDPLLLTDELRRCSRKLERRRSIGHPLPLPLDAESPLDPADRPRLLIPVLTGALLIFLCTALGALLLRDQLHRWTHRNRPLESIGVPIGVPENAPGPPNKAVQSPAPVVTNQKSLSSTPAEPTTPTAREASAEQSTAVVANERPSVASAVLPEPSVSPESTFRPRVEDSPLVTQEAATPAPAQSPVETAAPVIADNRIAEPSPPSEAPPPSTAAAASAPQEARTIAEQPEPQTTDQTPTKTDTAESTSPETSEGDAARNTARSRIASAPAKPARANSTAARHNNTRPPRERALPPMRVGTTQARFVGTTPDGKWILRLSSGNTVVTPPLPDTNDVPVISHHRVRKVQEPLRALPADDRPPILVLPPHD
jgi:serine/threonine protein kinase